MKAAFIYFAVRVFSAIIGIAAIALYTRLVSPEAYGVFTLILSAVTTLFALGYQWLRSGLLRFLPAEESFSSHPLAAAVLGYVWISGALITITVILLLWPDLPVTNSHLLIGLGCALSLSAMELLLASVQARRQPMLYALLTGFRALGALIIGGSLAYLGFSAIGLLIGYFLAHALPVLIALLWQWRLLTGLPFKTASLRPLVDFGWPMAVIGIGGAIVGVSDRYMIAWLAGTAEAGIYAAPYDLAQRSLNVLMLAAFLAFSPAIFRAYDQKEQDTLEGSLKDQSRLMLITSLPCGLILALSAPLVASLFFGAEYRKGATLLIPWIAAAAIIQGWNSYYLSYGYTLTHKVVINAMVVVVGAIINLVLNFWLIPLYGALGAAIATLATYAMLFSTSLMLTKRWIELPWGMIDFKKMSLIAVIAIAAMGLLQQDQSTFALAIICLCLIAFVVIAMLMLNVGNLRGDVAKLWQRLRISAH